MYEVFLNEKKIVIAAPGKITNKKTLKTTDDLQTTVGLRKWFLKFSGNDVQEAVIVSPEPEQFFENVFQKIFTVIYAGGGVVRRSNSFLFIYRNEKWDLPKGKIDDGETSEEGAIREVAEECGILGHQITKQLPSTFHIYQSEYKDTAGEWIFKETFWFEMEYKSLENGHPQTDENIAKIRWLEKEEFDEVLLNTHANLIPLVNLYRD